MSKITSGLNFVLIVFYEVDDVEYSVLELINLNNYI